MCHYKPPENVQSAHWPDLFEAEQQNEKLENLLSFHGWFLGLTDLCASISVPPLTENTKHTRHFL